MIVTMIDEFQWIGIDIVVVVEQRCGFSMLLAIFGPILFQFVFGMGECAASAARTYRLLRIIAAHARLVIVCYETGLLQLSITMMLHVVNQTDHHMFDGFE